MKKLVGIFLIILGVLNALILISSLITNITMLASSILTLFSVFLIPLFAAVTFILLGVLIYKLPIQEKEPVAAEI